MRCWWKLCTVCLLIIAGFPAISNAQEQPQLFVTIEGVNGQEARNIRNLLQIYEFNERSAPGAARVRYLHNQAERNIRRALAPYGYYRPTIEDSLERRENNWYAHYRITPGEPVLIRNVTIEFDGEARNDQAFSQLRRQLPVQQGQRLRHSEYESARSRIRDMASERGYYEARFTTAELNIDLKDYAADIVLVLDSGPRYRFGTVTFPDDSHLDEDVLRRFIGFEEGQYITSSDLLQLQLGMSDSDYFSRVEIRPQWSEANEQKEVPVRVDLEPNERTFYQFGLGYGTDTGPRVSFDQNRRWVNTRGHRFNTQFQFSEIMNTIAGAYIIPGQRPQTDQYAIRSQWTDEDTGNTRSERLRIGVSWQKELTRTQRIISLDWQTERDRIDGERRDTEYLIPSAQWTRIHADNRLNVSDGFRLSLTLRGAAEALLSDSDFAQSVISGKYVKRFHPQTRFIARAEGGTTVTSDFSQIPTSLRFYAGGDASVRGYGYRTISPTNDKGEVLGGRHMMTGSAEIDYEFRANQRMAIFVDSGQVFNDIRDPVRVGAGVGYRWQSPVGPIRVDLAHGFSGPGDKIRLHLTIGPDL